MITSRLVIGAGATGRTYRLRSWTAAAGVEPVVWLIGSPLRPVSGPDVAAALGDGAALVVADDLQWFAPEALERLTAAASVAVLASRRPPDGSEPAPDALDLLAEVLTRAEPAERTGLLDLDRFAPALAALHGERARGRADRALATAEVEAIHHLTGGSIGLAADIVATGWDPRAEILSPELIDAVQGRVRRAGPAVVELIRLWSVIEEAASPSDALSLARRALTATLPAPSPGPAPTGTGTDGVERAIRAGGLVGADGDLLPLIRRAAVADLTSAQRADSHDRLAAALAATDPAAAARHLLAGEARAPGAERILAAAAHGVAATDPEHFVRLVDRAEAVGLPAGETALLRALGAFHTGSPRALAHLEQAQQAEAADGGPGDDRAALLGFGLDLRDLRLASAAARPLRGPLAAPLQGVVQGLTGSLDTAAPPAGDAPAPLARVAWEVADGIAALGRGRTREAVAGLVRAADDFDRLAPTAPLGFTPHGLGALAALLVGDLAAVDHLCSQALAQRSGGAGEVLFHQLLRAYGRLVRGDYRATLDLLRRQRRGPAGSGPWDDDHDETFGAGNGSGPDAVTTGPASGPVAGAGDSGATGGALDPGLVSQRDRLVLASLEAAVARRSGDTARLRAAWQAAEQALLRPSVSWLFTDPMIELLAAGARLGDRRRVDPIATELMDQALALPADGPGPVSGLWLGLQVALAADDRDQVEDCARRMADLQPGDERSQARVAAAGVWARIVAGKATEAEVTEAAARVTAVGDGWEASRLLGQAALDEDDPRAARRLLELARVSATEPVDADNDDALVSLGLSEREAEVALMVVDGRTHKEIGAQLFISPKTVEHHVARIRQKLGATSRAELVATIREAVGQA